MNDIFKILREIRLEMFKVVILESFLDATLLFMGTFLIFSLFNFYPSLAIIPAVIFLGYLIFTRMRKFRLKNVEDRNPIIREMLRTAADNANQDNFVIRALNTELIKKMRSVTSASFMKLNRVIFKIGGIAILSVLIIYISTMQIRLLDMDKILHPNFNPNAKEGSLQDLFGDKEVLPQLGNKAVSIKLNPLSYEVNIDKISDAKPKEFRNDFPQEIVAVQEKSYDENIPRQQQIIIKNYFSSLN